MKIRNLVLIPAVLTLSAFLGRNDKNAYQLYDEKGKDVSYEKMLKAAQNADVVLFGELHNNPMCHWLQLELTKDLHEKKGADLVLGAEMFEADDQIVLNEYLAGKVTAKTFKDEAKLWTNYTTDYKPLVDFALKEKLRFIATNIPRRYANMVYSKGVAALDSIDREAKKWIAPLPFLYDGELKGYKEIQKATGGHGGENLPKSQAIKDATMAHFIYANFRKGATFIHYNGTYHSNNFEGIYWYLKKANPDLKIVTIASVEQKKIDKLEDENKNLADFIICSPESMTKTY